VILYSKLKNFLKMGAMTAFLHRAGKCSYDRLRLKIYLSSGVNIVEQLFMIKLGMPSGPTDFEGLTRLIALKMSNSVMGSKCKKSLDNEPE
jgi:hypothetical protein